MCTSLGGKKYPRKVNWSGVQTLIRYHMLYTVKQQPGPWSSTLLAEHWRKPLLAADKRAQGGVNAAQVEKEQETGSAKTGTASEASAQLL